jgi:hypothetical protein
MGMYRMTVLAAALSSLGWGFPLQRNLPDYRGTFEKILLPPEPFANVPRLLFHF